VGEGDAVTRPGPADLHVTLSGRGDLAASVYRQVRAAILDGRLPPGQALPSSRELARRLEVSRNTVAGAYERLLAEGFLATRGGVGTYVTGDIHPRRPQAPPPSTLRPRPVWQRVSPPRDLSAEAPDFDFRPGVADVRSFPFETWRANLSRHLRAGAVGRGTHIDAAGHPGLRAALARHVAVSRGVRATPEDVFVTSGSQQAVDLITRVLVEPGEPVAVEDPGYLPVLRALRAHGCQVTGVAVDGEGLRVADLPAGARLVYTSPAHQFPLGTAMSLPRRLALLDHAARTGAAVVEDDYDSEFRFAGRPLEPLQSLDRVGHVLYVGSLSKVMLPTLRLGFLVAPAVLHDALRKAKHVSDWHTAVPEQAAAADFIDSGQLARHIRRMRVRYARRHERVTAVLQERFPGLLRVLPSAAGLHLTALFADPAADDVAVAARARAVGVAVEPLSRYGVDAPGPSGLILGYGGVDLERIDEGLRRLRACLGA
jgi:GntR family transcriptional regulator/MocR family aminotransferase